MSEPHPLAVLLFWGTILLCMFGFSLYVARNAKRKSRARLDELERRREESRVYWAERIRLATEDRIAQQRTATPVAQTFPEPHNPGRRRILPIT